MSLSLLTVDQRGIDREVAVARVSRWLDRKTAEIEISRKATVVDPALEDRRRAAAELGENIHGGRA